MRYDETVKKEVFELYKKGVSKKDIMKKYGMSNSTLNQWISKLNRQYKNQSTVEKNTIETCRFKAIARIRDDLTQEEKDIVFKRMNWLFDRLNVVTDDGFTYYCPIRNSSEFSSVSFFAIELKHISGLFDELKFIEIPKGKSKERHPDYEKYRFKVIAKPKENLSLEDQKLLDDKMEFLLSRLNLAKIDDDYTYYCPTRNNEDFGNVVIFYNNLEDIKQCFEKLEYYDYVKENYEVAIDTKKEALLMEKLKDLLKTDDAQELFDLSLKYLDGVGVEKDDVIAMECLNKAISLNHAPSYNLMGICYRDGDGVKHDDKKAFEFFKKSAELGYVSGQRNLADCYYDGDGVSLDLSKAIYWYTKSAEQGNNFAQGSLGYCYLTGHGVEKDYNKAVDWFQKSADKDNNFSQTNLGECYYHGLGVEKNHNIALEWFEKSSEKGCDIAQNYLGDLYSCGENVIHDKLKSFEYYEKSAMKENGSAQFKLAMCYHSGDGVEKDENKALYWHIRASKNGNGYSMAILAESYYKGKGVNQSNVYALEWYEKSIENINDDEIIDAIKIEIELIKELIEKENPKTILKKQNKKIEPKIQDLNFELSVTEWNLVEEVGYPKEDDWCFIVTKFTTKYDWGVAGYNAREKQFYANFGMGGLVYDQEDIVAWRAFTTFGEGEDAQPPEFLKVTKK